MELAFSDAGLYLRNNQLHFCPSNLPSVYQQLNGNFHVGVKEFSMSMILNIPYILTYFYYQPAAREARSWLVLRLLCGFHVCIYICVCVCTYHVCNNYVTYIVAVRPYFSRLRQFRWLLYVAAMSSLPQLRLRDGYREAEAT